MPTPQTLVIEGKTIAVSVSGTGNKNIVFVHGASQSGETWLPQLNDPALKQAYRMFAIDLPGHGSSQRLDHPNAYGLKELANILMKTIEALQLDQFILVSLSFGTCLTGEIAPPPANCLGIILASPCILNHQLDLSEIMTLGPLGHVIAAENPSDDDLREYIRNSTTSEVVTRTFYHSYRNTDPAFRKSIGNIMMNGEWTDELMNIKKWAVPVCVVFGEEEKLVNPNYLDNFDPLWSGKVVRIENAGHAINEENPDAFNRLIDNFASEVFH